MGRLAGKVLLITGSTGIAEATALLAADEGARVFVVGKDTATVTSLAARVGATYAIADLTSTEQTDTAVSACSAQYGRIDAAFHVAGISGRRFGDGPLHECTDEGWAMTLDVNLGSTFRVCRALLRTMLQQPPDAGGRRGAILTMGSVTAISPEPRHFATHGYAASKSGIMGLSEATASYYAPHGIRINALAPGLVRTPMSRRAQNDAEIMAFMKDKQPLADLIEPDDIARAAVFLLSDEARTITGVVFPVDAGWRVS